MVRINPKSFSTVITVPMISPMIFYILITSVIGGFKTLFIRCCDHRCDRGYYNRVQQVTINLKTIVFYIYDYIAPAGQGWLNVHWHLPQRLSLFGIILFFTIFQPTNW